MHPESIRAMEKDTIRAVESGKDGTGFGVTKDARRISDALSKIRFAHKDGLPVVEGLKRLKTFVVFLSLVLGGSFYPGASGRPMPRGRPVTGPIADARFIFLGDAHLDEDGSIILMGGDSASSAGKAFYKDPFPFIQENMHAVASFHSGFVFSVALSSASLYSGVLSFLITGNPSSIRREPVLEVNFHIGLNQVSINVGKSYSSISADAEQDHFNFSNGMPVTAWLSYNSKMKSMNLWLNRSSSPLLVVDHLDLGQFYQELMHVGFSASKGKDRDILYIIRYWNFEIVEYSTNPPPKEPVEPDDKRPKDKEGAAPAPERAKHIRKKNWIIVIMALSVMLCLLLSLFFCGYNRRQPLIIWMLRGWDNLRQLLMLILPHLRDFLQEHLTSFLHLHVDNLGQQPQELIMHSIEIQSLVSVNLEMSTRCSMPVSNRRFSDSFHKRLPKKATYSPRFSM